MKYKIYQMVEHTNYRFEWWSWAKDEFNFKDYTLTYEGEIEIDEDEGPVAIQKALDDLFTIFNVNRPEDFKSHSLSVSDIIEINGGYWYCDNVGWVDVSKYIRPQ